MLEVVPLSIAPVTLAERCECDEGCEVCRGDRLELQPVLTAEEFMQLLSEPEVAW